jgi:thiol-disulfide isomerase/thioredoxin
LKASQIKGEILKVLKGLLVMKIKNNVLAFINAKDFRYANIMNKTNKAVMLVAGVVLLVAAILKIHQLLTEPILSRSFWESWHFFLIQIPLELGLSIWLLSTLFRKGAWLVALLAFGIFIGVTLHKGLIGVASCGCFGRVHVNPWITLTAIDIPIFLALLIFRPVGYKLLAPPWPSAKHFFSVAIPTFVILGALVPILALNKPPAKADRYEVLNPLEWNSKEMPLFGHIDIGDVLSQGISFILFYHNDCPDCREAIPMYDQMARDYEVFEQGMQFAFIEGPPFDESEETIVPDDTVCYTGQLDKEKEWIFISPLIVLTLDGIVMKAWEVDTPSFEQILEALSE